MSGTSRAFSARSIPAGFTFVELLIVLMILALMAAIVAPSFNMLAKGSRLRQATEAVMTAVNRAMTEEKAIRAGANGSWASDASHPGGVVVFFGEDLTAPTLVKPELGILPPAGQIEVWVTGMYQYVTVNNVQYPVWDNKQRPLTMQPVNFSDAIRIEVGIYDDVVTGPTPANPIKFSFGCGTNADANPSRGEILRHEIAFGVGYSQTNGAILIFDKYTGDNVIVLVRNYYGQTFANKRPYLAQKPIQGLCYTWTPGVTTVDLHPNNQMFQKQMDLVTAVNGFHNP